LNGFGERGRVSFDFMIETALMRARVFVFVVFLAATGGLIIYRRATVAERLVSMDEISREEAGSDLAKLSEAEKAELVPRLIGSLKSKEPTVRYLAVRALGNLGPAASAASPALLTMLNDTGMNSNVGAAAAEAFAHIDPAPVPRLVEALKDRDPETGCNVSRALGGLGPAAGEAVPLLRELAEDKDQELKLCAAQALEKIGPGHRGH